MNRLSILPMVILFLMIPLHLFAGEKLLTIIHSNDLHSHFLETSPNIDYSPLTTGEDKIIGEKYIEALKNLSTSQNSKIILLPGDIPAAVRGIISAIGK